MISDCTALLIVIVILIIGWCFLYSGSKCSSCSRGCSCGCQQTGICQCHNCTCSCRKKSYSNQKTEKCSPQPNFNYPPAYGTGLSSGEIELTLPHPKSRNMTKSECQEWNAIDFARKQALGYPQFPLIPCESPCSLVKEAAAWKEYVWENPDGTEVYNYFNPPYPEDDMSDRYLEQSDFRIL